MPNNIHTERMVSANQNTASESNETGSRDNHLFIGVEYGDVVFEYVGEKSRHVPADTFAILWAVGMDNNYPRVHAIGNILSLSFDNLFV